MVDKAKDAGVSRNVLRKLRTTGLRATVGLAVSTLLFGAGLQWGVASDLPPDISLWDKSVNLRAGAGYKDNLLLSAVTKEKSVFSVVAADLSIFRLPIDGPQVNIFVSYEDTRYWEGRLLDKEQFLASQV